MLLNVKQRLLLLNILPKEGDYVTLKVIRDQQSLLSFGEEEFKRLNIKREGDTYTWKEEDDIPVDIPMGEAAVGVIKMALRMLNEKGQLKIEFLPLYEHFWEGKKWPPSSDGQTEST